MVGGIRNLLVPLTEQFRDEIPGVPGTPSMPGVPGLPCFPVKPVIYGIYFKLKTDVLKWKKEQFYLPGGPSGP